MPKCARLPASLGGATKHQGRRQVDPARPNIVRQPRVAATIGLGHAARMPVTFLAQRGELQRHNMVNVPNFISRNTYADGGVHSCENQRPAGRPLETIWTAMPRDWSACVLRRGKLEGSERLSRRIEGLLSREKGEEDRLVRCAFPRAIAY
jgi:hypothetical protein